MEEPRRRYGRKLLALDQSCHHHGHLRHRIENLERRRRWAVDQSLEERLERTFGKDIEPSGENNRRRQRGWAPHKEARADQRRGRERGRGKRRTHVRMREPQTCVNKWCASFFCLSNQARAWTFVFRYPEFEKMGYCCGWQGGGTQDMYRLSRPTRRAPNYTVYSLSLCHCVARWRFTKVHSGVLGSRSVNRDTFFDSSSPWNLGAWGRPRNTSQRPCSKSPILGCLYLECCQILCAKLHS